MNTVIVAYDFTDGNSYSVSVSGDDRPRPAEALLLPRPGGRAGLQGRHGRRQRRAGHRPDPLPSLASVGPRDRLQRRVQLLQPAAGRRFDGQPAEPDGQQPAGRCVGSLGRRPADVRRGQRAVHVDGLGPRGDGLSEPRHDRARPRSACRSLGRTRSRTSSVRSPDAPSGRPSGAPASGRSRSRTSQMQSTTVIPAGATSLRATIGSPSDPAADLDLFVLTAATATGGQTRRRRLRGVGDDRQPGRGRRGRSSSTASRPRRVDDVRVHRRLPQDAAFGAVSVTDANALRPAGATWTVPGTVTANAAPAAGRVLYGNVEVRTDTNVLVGSGDVIVHSVSP